MLMQEENETWMPNLYSEQTNNMWSLKSLVTLKYKSRTSLHAEQLSDNQALFWCSVLIILE